MVLADVFSILFLILGFIIAFVSYWLLAAGLFPGMVERAAERWGAQPIASTVVGGAVAAPLIGIGVYISSVAPNGALKLGGLLLALLPVLLALFGSAGIALRIGAGLRSSKDESDPWRRVLRGSIVLGLSFVMPIIGWFGISILTLAGGFGAFLLDLVARAQKPAARLELPPLPAAALGGAGVLGGESAAVSAE